MSEKIYPVPAEWESRAFINDAKYKEMYARSVSDPDGFWAEQAKRIDWIKPFTKVKDTSFDTHNVYIKWFEDGTTNLSMNCIDRHLAKRGDQVAIIWEGDNPAESKHITYKQLHEEVCRYANVLKAKGVGKGDTVTIYMPMIPETAYAMLACARIGAVHSVVFGGFSPDSLAGRIGDCKSKVLITADEGVRGGRKVNMKANADAAIEKTGDIVKTQLVVKRTGGEIAWKEGRDCWMHEEEAKVSTDCPPTEMNAEDPLFILYTSGSTGTPKGVVHTTAGYLVYVALTHQTIFDYHDGDIYWCTADVGWVTGHSYIVYGPLCNGATTLMFEGVPNYPTISRFWDVVDKHQVNIFYTAPTAIRSLMGAGEEPVKQNLAQKHSPARHGRRTDQSGSLGMVLPRGRRKSLPDCRHLVADRDRRHSHYAAAGRQRFEARFRDPSLFRYTAAGRGPLRQCDRGPLRRQSRHCRRLAGPDAHGLWRP